MSYSSDKYYIYHIDEYGCKKYFMGDRKFTCWLASTCGATSYDNLYDVCVMVVFLTEKENISVNFQKNG